MLPADWSKTNAFQIYYQFDVHNVWRNIFQFGSTGKDNIEKKQAILQNCLPQFQGEKKKNREKNRAQLHTKGINSITNAGHYILNILHLLHKLILWLVLPYRSAVHLLFLIHNEQSCNILYLSNDVAYFQCHKIITDFFIHVLCMCHIT